MRGSSSRPTGEPPPRPPERAVAFTHDYNTRLELPARRLEEKEVLMRESASAFFRAMPALFHEDLRGPWRDASRLLDHPAPWIPVVGDMHIGNLGTVRGPEGKAVWGLNDFDQAAPGSPEVDLTRLATSAVLTAREAGLGARRQEKAVEALGQAYFGELERLTRGGKNPGPFLGKKEAEGSVEELIARARDVTPEQGLEKYVRLDGENGPRFQSSDTLRPVSPETRDALETALGPYEAGLRGVERVALPLRVLDWARRLDAGGSSYGLARYYALVRAKDADEPPILLELKELLAPSLEWPPVPAEGASVVRYQEEFGADCNPLTGAVAVDGRAFLMRELEPEKARLDEKALNSDKELLSAFAQAAVVLARAHASSRARADVLAHWVGDDAKEATKRLVSFARGYADQVQADWRAFREGK
ncbi:DUF2252 family protein [Archangium violaceum]|uniref:DUF2252 family protein n=1 Tax=Archangium violaceum TaxID=83451 RepID=UPI00194DC76A|nr:DUF2252 family protein [Archangium violaceum]QRN94960.1 DUF2252 family protein [Archangium violaceum]